MKLLRQILCIPFGCVIYVCGAIVMLAAFIALQILGGER